MVWCTIAAVCAHVAPSVASAATTSPPLRIPGGDAAERRITLTGCRTVGPASAGLIQALRSGRCPAPAFAKPAAGSAAATQLVAIGQLLLAVENTTGLTISLGLRYVREDGHAARLPGCSGLAQLAGGPPFPATCQPCAKKRVRRSRPCRGLGHITVRPHALITLPLRFALLSNEPPQALRGALYVSAHRQTMVVPLAANVEALPAVRPESSVLRLSTDRWEGATTTVTVVGPGVGAMLARQSRAPRTFVLRDGGGDAAEVELDRFKPLYVTSNATSRRTGVSARAGSGTTASQRPAIASRTPEPLRASAQLKLVNHPHVGAYNGQIPLSELDASAPLLEVRVRSHLPLWLAILFVFVGVAAANIIAPLALLRQRGTTLSDALSKAVKNCKEAMEILHRGGYVGEERAVLWDLNDAVAHLSDGADGDVRDVGLVSIAQRLLEKIDSERDDEDFDEDRTSVLEVIARLSRWLRTAPAAVRLQQVLDASEQQMHAAGCSLAGTTTLRDTQLVRKRLMREPANASATDDLVERVLRQAFWHRAFSSALARASKTTHSAAQPLYTDVRKQLVELDETLKAPGILERTPEEQDALEITLEALREQLGQPPSPAPPRLPGQEGLDVNWQAPPNLFTGWSAIDAAGFHDLTVDAGRPYRPGSNFKEWAETTFKDLALWGWSLFFTLVTSIVYALTVYNSTWGSTKDVLTALTAGFAGAVTLKIALPIFKSQRLRPAAPGG